jgi:hypothetical protein
MFVMCGSCLCIYRKGIYILVSLPVRSYGRSRFLFQYLLSAAYCSKRREVHILLNYSDFSRVNLHEIITNVFQHEIIHLVNSIHLKASRTQYCCKTLFKINTHPTNVLAFYFKPHPYTSATINVSSSGTTSGSK